MARYDFKRLRKENKIKQSEICDAVGVTQGFFSSVENGRNPFPEDRVSRLHQAFPKVDFEKYRIAEDATPVTATPGSNNSNSNNSDVHINDPEFMKEVVELVKKSMIESMPVKDIVEAEKEVAQNESDRASFLAKENDKLRCEAAGYIKKIECLREEIQMLKEILMDNGISPKKAIQQYKLEQQNEEN